MNNFSDNNGDHFANGQVDCDLRGNSDMAQSETHLDPVEGSITNTILVPTTFSALR